MNFVFKNEEEFKKILNEMIFDDFLSFNQDVLNENKNYYIMKNNKLIDNSNISFTKMIKIIKMIEQNDLKKISSDYIIKKEIDDIMKKVKKVVISKSFLSLFENNKQLNFYDLMIKSKKLIEKNKIEILKLFNYNDYFLDKSKIKSNKDTINKLKYLFNERSYLNYNFIKQENFELYFKLTVYANIINDKINFYTCGLKSKIDKKIDEILDDFKIIGIDKEDFEKINKKRINITNYDDFIKKTKDENKVINKFETENHLVFIIFSKNNSKIKIDFLDESKNMFCYHHFYNLNHFIKNNKINIDELTKYFSINDNKSIEENNEYFEIINCIQKQLTNFD